VADQYFFMVGAMLTKSPLGTYDKQLQGNNKCNLFFGGILQLIHLVVHNTG